MPWKLGKYNVKERDCLETKAIPEESKWANPLPAMEEAGASKGDTHKVQNKQGAGNTLESPRSRAGFQSVLGSRWAVCAAAAVMHALPQRKEVVTL